MLALQTPSVALQHPIPANHAMTRNDDGDWISADCSADVLGHTGIGMAQGPRELPIGGGLSSRNFSQCGPDHALEITAIGSYCNVIQGGEIAFEVAIELSRNHLHGLGVAGLA